MKNVLLMLLLTAMLAGTSSLKGAEIIPVWNNINEAGMIHDIEFLRGENQFILLAGVAEEGTIQIRDTQTGDLISSYPIRTLGQFNQIEITPDSNRCIITTGGSRTIGPTIEFRNLGDYSLISKDTLIMDAETKDPHGNPYYYAFHDMIVDPVRPLVYVMLEKTNFSQNESKDRFYLKVYNYETMQLVKDLTPVGYEYEDMKCFDVSDDGRYLAALNEGKAYLKVWDLESQKIIKNQQLYDNNLTNPNDYNCEVKDIEFSTIDNDLIYYSGVFPKSTEVIDPDGVFRFTLSNSKTELIDLKERYAGGIFTLFDNEKRIFITSGSSLSIINQELKTSEITVSTSFELPFGLTSILNNSQNKFIGFSNQFICYINYDSQSGINNSIEEEIRTNPNPTNGIVNINLECPESNLNYQISDITGAAVAQSTIADQSGNLQLDFSAYATGVYFLTINCKSPKTFKIIKE